MNNKKKESSPEDAAKKTHESSSDLIPSLIRVKYQLWDPPTKRSVNVEFTIPIVAQPTLEAASTAAAAQPALPSPAKPTTPATPADASASPTATPSAQQPQASLEGMLTKSARDILQLLRS